MSTVPSTVIGVRNFHPPLHGLVTLATTHLPCSGNDLTFFLPLLSPSPPLLSSPLWSCLLIAWISDSLGIQPGTLLSMSRIGELITTPDGWRTLPLSSYLKFPPPLPSPPLLFLSSSLLLSFLLASPLLPSFLFSPMHWELQTSYPNCANCSVHKGFSPILSLPLPLLPSYLLLTFPGFYNDFMSSASAMKNLLNAARTPLSSPLLSLPLLCYVLFSSVVFSSPFFGWLGMAQLANAPHVPSMLLAIRWALHSPLSQQLILQSPLLTIVDLFFCTSPPPSLPPLFLYPL